MKKYLTILFFTIVIVTINSNVSFAQIGRRFPSEKKLIKDPVTGTMLTFLTSTESDDSKIYKLITNRLLMVSG